MVLTPEGAMVVLTVLSVAAGLVLAQTVGNYLGWNGRAHHAR